MTRAQQVRAVFHVLKETLGDQYSAGDLLRSAAALVEACRTLDEEEALDRRVGPREAFFASEVDKAMADGGWRVLDFERRAGMHLLDELPERGIVVQKRLDRLVGRPEWPRIETVWP